MKSIKAKLQTRKASGGLLGAELTELCKSATAKDVPQPDDELNQAVVDAVNSSSESSGVLQLREVLHKRMFMKNPHKVWLATHLAEAILQKCTDVISPIRSDIYQDLAVIASKPLDRYQANFKDEQRAKMHAFAVLRGSGKQGQSVLRHTLKMGKMVSLTPAPATGKSAQRIRHANGDIAKPDSRSNSATEKKQPEDAAAKSPDAASASINSNGRGDGGARAAAGESSGKGSKRPKMSWPEVKEAVTNSLGVAGSHTSMIQELAMNIAGGKSAAPDFERQFLAELADELVSFRSAFEQLLGVLSSHKHEDAKPLVKQSLEAIDEMNNALALYKDVVGNLPETGHVSEVAAGATAAGASAAPLGGASASSGMPRPRTGFGSGRGSLRSSKASEAGATASAAAALQQPYAPAAQRSTAGASRADSGSKKALDGIAGLGLGEGNRKAERSRSKGLERANSGGPVDPFAPVAALQHPPAAAACAQQQQPQPQHIQTPQYFQQAPIFFPSSQAYPPHAQQQQQFPQQFALQQYVSQGLASGFIPMPHAQMGQQPTLYMPVTGPNGEQGFAPVAFPPNGQFPASSAMYQPPYAPSAAAPPHALGPHQYGGGQPAAPPQQQHALSSNSFAPSSTNGGGGGGNGVSRAQLAAGSADIDGGVTDSESEPEAPASEDEGSRIPHVSSSSSSIFPADAAAGALADAGLGKFPAAVPAATAALPQPQPTLVASQPQQAPIKQEAGGKFDQVFEQLVN